MSIGFAIGVDLGGTNLRVAIVDEQGRMLEKLVTPTVELRTSERVINRMCEHIAQLTKKHESTGTLHGIGIAIPGIIDLDSGILRESPNLPGWYDYPVRDEIEKRLGTKVILENDANAAAMGEFWLGAAREYDSTCMLTLGTGIGGGLIVNGRLVHGARGAAAELGHIIVDADGPPCPGSCPNHGCLEALVSGHAIGVEGLRLARSAPNSALGRALDSGREITGALVTELAHDGDPAAGDVMRMMGERLGLGVVSLVNVFNPEVVVVGGGAIAAGELLLAPAREVVAARALPINRADVRLVSARFGAESGMLGAACMALDAAGVTVG